MYHMGLFQAFSIHQNCNYTELGNHKKRSVVSYLTSPQPDEIDGKDHSYDEQHYYDTDKIDTDINDGSGTACYEKLMIFIKDRKQD